MERGDDPLAVDEPERVRQAHEDARVDAHPGAIAGQHLVHHVADRGAEVRAVERVDQRRRDRLDEPLVPALLARDLDAGGQQGRDGVGPGQPGQPERGVPGRRRRDLLRRPARHRVDRGPQVGRLDALGAAGQEIGDVEARDLVGDVVLREHPIAHHGSHPAGHQLPVGGDDGGVGDGQAERMPEQCGDREPVGEAAHDAGLRDGQDEAAPPPGAQRIRGHRQGHRRQQHDQGEPPLVRPTPGFGSAAAVHGRSLLWTFGPA